MVKNLKEYNQFSVFFRAENLRTSFIFVAIKNADLVKKIL